MLPCDEAVGAWILDRRQDDRRFRTPLAMQAENRAQVDLGQHVAVEHHDRFGQLIARIANRAPRAKRDRLDDVTEADAESFALAEDLLDAARLVVEAENRLVNFRDLAQ